MAFLAYRFIPAGLIVALLFRRSLAQLPPAGWRAGLVMGVFLTAGYIFQTVGLEYTSASNAGFITGLFVVLTPLFARVIFGVRPGPTAWAAALVSALGLLLLTGGGGDSSLKGNALVFGCACAFAAHILVTDLAVRRFDVAPLVAIQLTLCGVVCLVVAAALGDLESATRGDGLERAARDVRRRQRPRVPGPELRAADHLSRADRSDPRCRARVRRLLRIPARRRPPRPGRLDGRGADPWRDRGGGRSAAAAAAAAVAGGLTRGKPHP